MGLIDANKIPYLHLDLENKVKFDDVNIAFKDDIDNMPIVKAIPIEWINKWLRKYGEPILDDGICKMIEDWEKENDNKHTI